MGIEGQGAPDNIDGAKFLEEIAVAVGKDAERNVLMEERHIGDKYWNWRMNFV